MTNLDDCTHGADCKVHPKAQQIHNYDNEQPAESAAVWRVRAEAAERIIRALMTPAGVLYADGRRMVAAHERRYKVKLTGPK